MSHNGLEKQWKKYLQYLNAWVASHTGNEFIGMSPAGFDRWLACEGNDGSEKGLPECDSEYCIFNPNGYCCFSLVYAKQPEVDEDGCKGFIFREGVKL